MAVEREAKLKLANPEAARRRLAELGAEDEGVVTERNWVLDDAAGGLRARGTLLRVRNFGDAAGIVTVKLPLDAGGRFKVREEIETATDSCEDALRQLFALGFQISRIYEKRRHTWLWRKCLVCLDECPEIGFFLEVEGEESDIRDVCSDLGLDPANHIEDNYLMLWEKHLAARGEPVRNMVF